MSVATPVRESRLTSVHVAAWAVPVMVVGQFAMVAIVPLAYVLFRTFRDARLRPLRWWAAAVGVAYATPLALWAIGPDRAPSLSKDMHPALAAIVVATGVAYAIGLLVVRNRQRGS
jgi:hypothetical protein